MENWNFIIKRILWVLAVLPLPLLAQETVVTLDSVLKRIENNNTLLQTYALRAESFTHKAEAGMAWMAPMVGFGTYMTPYPGQHPRASDQGALMLQLEQDIPNPWKLKAQKRFVESQGPIELSAREITLNEMKAKAKILYYTLIVAGARIRVLLENDRILQMVKKIEQIRYPYNQSQLSGVFRADAGIGENQNMISMQEGETARAKAELNSMMNLPPDQELKIDTAYVPRFIAELFPDTLLLAGRRKDIARVEQNIHSMKLGIDAMRLEAKPDFQIRLDHMTPLGNMMPNAYSIMGMISIPIAPWSSGKYKSGIKAMDFEIQAMQKERSAMLLESQGTLVGMNHEIRSMEKRITALEETIIPALKRTMDADLINYQENKLALPEMIRSWEALTMMQIDVLDEKMKLYKMIAGYEKELYQ